MGRTIVPFRWIFEQEKQTWYKRIKKTHYINYAEKIFSEAAFFNDAGSNWGIGQVFEKVLFLLLFSQYKNLKKLEMSIKKK